jgi:hypothetical protein
MKIVFNILCFIVFLTSVNTVFACSCYRPTPPPCYAFGKSDAVFVGSIKEFTRLSEESYFDGVKIEVEQSYKGVKRKYIDSQSSRFDSMCGNNFRKDVKYLFYGSLSKDGNEYQDWGICWRTQIYNNSSPDFDFLNLVNESKPIYWVWGTFSKGSGGSPLKGVKAEIFNGKKKITAFSDNNGIIKIPVSKVGKFPVKVVLPRKMEPHLSDWMMEEKIYPRIKSRNGIFTVEYIVDVKPNQC